jgi:group I intron endonuclease
MSKGIYRIYNKIINKTYVGKSIDIDSRKYQHFNDLINGVHNNSQLQKDYNEYGKQNFEFEILETVEDDNKLDYLEDYYIKKYDALVNGYNQCRGNIKSVLKGIEEESLYFKFLGNYKGEVN